MKRNVFTFFALALTALAIGCSGGGSGGEKSKNKDKAADPGTVVPGTAAPMPAGATRPTGISQQPWCANTPDSTAQVRLTLFANGSAVVDQFALTDGARGGLLNQFTGSWYIENNNTMVFKIDGQAEQREAVRLDPNSPTGAAQLTFGTPPNSATYDPCS